MFISNTVESIYSIRLVNHLLHYSSTKESIYLIWIYQNLSMSKYLINWCRHGTIRLYETIMFLIWKQYTKHHWCWPASDRYVNETIIHVLHVLDRYVYETRYCESPLQMFKCFQIKYEYSQRFIFIALHYTIHSHMYSISQEICTRFCCALLCCGYAIVHNEFTWSIYLYSSGLLCWHWGNR